MLPDVHAAAKDGGEHGVGALERLGAVGGGGELGGVVAGLDDFRAGLARHFEAAGMDVHERNLGVGERGEGEAVLDEAAGEAEASGADEHDFSHGGFPWVWLKRQQ